MLTPSLHSSTGFKRPEARAKLSYKVTRHQRPVLLAAVVRAVEGERLSSV